MHTLCVKLFATSKRDESTVIAIFDLETCLLSSDVAPDGAEIGWSPARRRLMGISWGVAWCSDGHYRHYDEHNLSTLASLLEEAALVVSYNGISFDLPLLAGVLERKVTIRRHCDLLEIIKEAGGRRYSLDEMALVNLPEGKGGSGKDAPPLYQAGRFAELATYCERDVMLTRGLFFLATERGWLFSPHGGRVVMPAQWVQAKVGE